MRAMIMDKIEKLKNFGDGENKSTSGYKIEYEIFCITEDDIRFVSN